MMTFQSDTFRGPALVWPTSQFARIRDCEKRSHSQRSSIGRDPTRLSRSGSSYRYLAFPFLGAALAAWLLTTTSAFGEPASLTRPDPAGVPTEVLVGIFVMDISSIVDAAQTFETNFFLIQRWRDARLAFDAPPGSKAVRIVPLKELWHPELIVMNRRVLRTALPEQARVSADGSVLYRQRYYGTVASPLDLREFPFDHQKLRIQTASLHEAEDIVLRADPDRVGRLENFSLAGWNVELVGLNVDTFAPVAGQKRQRASLVLDGERVVGYFVLKLFIPLGLIVFMAWTVLFIGHDQMGPRIGIATASIFTLIAFQLSLGRVLPPISYLTRADRFLLGSSLLVYLALAQTIVSSKLNAGGRKDWAQRLDRHTRWIYVVLFALVAIQTLSS